MAPIRRRGQRPAKPPKARFVLRAAPKPAPKTRFTVTYISAEAGWGGGWEDGSFEDALASLTRRAKNRLPPPEGLNLLPFIAGFIYDASRSVTVQYRFDKSGNPIEVTTHKAIPIRIKYWTQHLRGDSIKALTPSKGK